MPSGTRMGSIIRVSVFLASFTAMNLAVGLVFPLQQDVLIQAKFDELRAASPPYDLLFVGPSTTYNHINAGLFEQRVKALGRTMHAFNFGTPAMHLCEAHSIVRHVLSMDDLDVRWVVFDLDLAHNAYDHNPFTRRYIGWHDLPGTVCDIRTTLSTDLPVREQLTRLYHGVRAFVYHAGNAGALAQVIGDRVISPTLTDQEREYLASGKRGFLPIDLGVPFNPRRNQRYLMELGTYRQLGDHVWGVTADEDDLPKLINGVVYQKQMVELLESRSIQSAFFVSPDLNRDEDYQDMLSRETGTVIFAFNDIDAYPGLYHVDYRFGLRHLNGAGADRFTGLLAEQYSRYLDQTGR